MTALTDVTALAATGALRAVALAEQGISGPAPVLGEHQDILAGKTP